MRRMIPDKDIKKLEYIRLLNQNTQFSINNESVFLSAIEDNASKASISLSTGNDGVLELMADGAYTMSGYYSDDAGDYLYQIQIGKDGIQLQTLDENSGDFVSKLTIDAGGNIIPDIPTSDPKVKGALWNDSGVLKISAGE